MAYPESSLRITPEITPFIRTAERISLKFLVKRLGKELTKGFSSTRLILSRPNGTLGIWEESLELTFSKPTPAIKAEKFTAESAVPVQNGKKLCRDLILQST